MRQKMKRLNEYGIISGGYSADKLDMAAHNMAKIIAQNSGFNLDNYVVVTKSLKVDYKVPIKTLCKSDLRVFNRGFYKGKDFHINASICKKKGGIYITVAEARLVFTCKKRSEFEQTII